MTIDTAQPADLAELLAAGERAAFHGRPASGVAALESAFEQARSEGKGAEATAAAWLLGVCLEAAGKFGGSLAVLEPLVAAGTSEVPERRLFAALAASTSAAVRRQLGQHEHARQLDEAALAYGDGAPEAVFDATVGLAADAVAAEDAAAATHLLDRARAIAEGHNDWWQQRVRLAWVEAEVALLVGDTDRAAELLQAAVQLAEGSGAPRHVAKTLLLLGVAHVQAGDLSGAETTLRRSATLAESLGALPTLWPARALLGALLEESSPAESAKSLAAARSGVIAIADDLPDDLRDVWLDRPDVAALLGG
ncbi:MAG TPA: tetratricopeptide repeat protein [Actinomycetes bacterium]|nr:tetratricopeptide repeat protein [Actinomycetes bacterium]